MVGKLIFFYGLLVICMQHGEAFFFPKTQLVLSSVMFRHGDRAPDPMEFQMLPELATNKNYQPIGLGQLTNEGKLRLYSNGVMVRKMYDKFLGNVLNDGDVITYTTNIPRTGASASAFLAGVFPPIKEQQWTPICKPTDVLCILSKKPEISRLWNPIPYLYDQRIADEMISFYSTCSAYHIESYGVENLLENQQEFVKFGKLFEYITANTGIQLSSKSKVFLIVSLLIAKQSVDEPLPAWAVPVWDEMLEVTDLLYQIMFYNDKQKQLSGGSIALRILNDMVAKASGTLLPSNRKLIIYSGHDMSVAPLYAALGGSKGFVDLKGNPAPVNYPRFGATIFVELHQILTTGKYAVKVLYHNFKAAEPQTLRLVGCDEFCPLEEFITLTASTTISREEQIQKCSSA